MDMLSSISKPKKFIAEVSQQAVKIFMIWAVIMGPNWAQNLTMFCLWIVIVGMGILACAVGVAKEGALLKAKEDEAWARKQIASRTHWVRNIPAFALLGTLAAMGWTWTAIFYAITWFLMHVIHNDTVTKMENMLDESNGKV